MQSKNAPLYPLHLKRYRRHFLKPLKTHHGLWRDRTGLLVGLQHPDGAIGWGEIAPIPWFGTETLEVAISPVSFRRRIRLRWEKPPDTPMYSVPSDTVGATDLLNH